MKVLFTPEAFNQQHGGVSRVFVELARELARSGHDATVVAGLHINRHLHDVPNVVGLQVPEIGRIRGAVNTVFCQAMILATAPDVVHQTYYSRHRYPKRGKLVLTVFDMIHEIFADKYFTHPNQKKQSLNKAFCCARADHICAISQRTKDDLIRILGLPEEKVSVTYLGNPLEGVRPIEIKSPPDKKFVLFVGGRGWYKNFRSLLEAFRTSKRLKNDFNIVCFGGGCFSPEELSLMAEWNLSENVFHYAGGDQMLAGFYRSAAAYISVSLYEGFGLPLLEAMGLNCPIICSNRSSLPEVAGSAAAYVNPESVDDIRTVLEGTLYDERVLTELRRAGTERAGQFSWKRCANESLAVYRALG